MSTEEFQKNVLGEKLEPCSIDPITGWVRDGCCNTNEIDQGIHTVCVKVTTKFLEWAKFQLLQLLKDEVKLFIIIYLNLIFVNCVDI